MKSWRGGIWLENTSDSSLPKATYFPFDHQSTESDENATFFENHHYLLALYIRNCWIELTHLHEAWWKYCKDVYDFKNPILG